MAIPTLSSTARAKLNRRPRAFSRFLLEKELVCGCCTKSSTFMLRRESSSSNNAVDKSAGNYHPNASQIEVNKFSAFASHWWDSRSTPLVGMNPVRVKFIRNVVHEFQVSHSNASLPEDCNQTAQMLPLYNREILDIGCGGGLLTESLSRLGASLVVGVDATPKVVDVAKFHSFHERSRLAPLGKDEHANDSELQNNGYSRIQYILVG